MASAQDRPAPPAGHGSAPRPAIARPGLGLGPLQTEPGDIWAEVRGWTQPRKEAAEAAPKSRRAQPCAAGEEGCARKPARPRAAAE
ncbi:hypothetical protein [Roseicella aquatilis]|uniref:Uncharacterized protein n=1 Tax=Roseicella aquatilis TaxID=2527868 RepID=A0A4R4DFU7_9PROT|nr:hypothetical protein [Roseicella aquatilis]TCZ59824.1 hypothetical protein EXY23_14555 [Roseicella aquatilis]